MIGNLVQHEPLFVSDPKLVELYVSSRCSLRCTHCFHGKPYRVPVTLTLQQWLECAGELHSCGVRRFMIGGKEPFSEPITLELADGLKHSFAGITIGAVCDGFTWQRYAEDPRLRLFDFLECSVDGDREVHNLVRGKNAFERCNRGLQKAEQCIPRIMQSAAMAVGKINHHALHGVWESINTVGLKNLFVQPMEPVGYATPEMCLSVEEYSTVIKGALNNQDNLNGDGSIIFYLPFAHRSALSEYRSIPSEEGGVLWLSHGALNIGIMREFVRLPYAEHIMIDSSGALIPHFSLKEGVSQNPERAISVLEGGACHAVNCARTRILRWWKESTFSKEASGASGASETVFGEAARFNASMKTQALYNL